jgi:hypothetical protein
MVNGPASDFAVAFVVPCSPAFAGQLGLPVEGDVWSEITDGTVAPVLSLARCMGRGRCAVHPLSATVSGACLFFASTYSSVSWCVLAVACVRRGVQ